MDDRKLEGRFWFVTLIANRTYYDYAVVSEAIIGLHGATLRALQAFCSSEAGTVNEVFLVQATPLIPDRD